MANICDFDMRVVGRKENIKQFIDALTHNGTIWMGRGADVQMVDYDDEKQEAVTLGGWCKWSIQSSLIDDAVSMRTNPGIWYKLNTSYEYITLWEACERWDLKMEVYSEEPGCCFQEYYVCCNGDVLVDECVDWYEYPLFDYESFEKAKEEIPDLTIKEWEKEEYVSRGGFESWVFTI